MTMEKRTIIRVVRIEYTTMFTQFMDIKSLLNSAHHHISA